MIELEKGCWGWHLFSLGLKSLFIYIFDMPTEHVEQRSLSNEWVWLFIEDDGGKGWCRLFWFCEGLLVRGAKLNVPALL